MQGSEGILLRAAAKSQAQQMLQTVQDLRCMSVLHCLEHSGVLTVERDWHQVIFTGQ